MSKAKIQTTFYKRVRPIAIFVRAWGIVPLQNLHDPNSSNLKFSCLSWPSSYSVLLLVACMGVLIGYSNCNSVIMQVLKANGNLLWACVLLMLLRSLACFFFLILRARKLVKLIQILDLFETEFLLLFKKESEENSSGWAYGKILKTGFTRFSIVLLGAGDMIAFVKLLETSIYFPAFPHIQHIIFTILGVWSVVPMYLYLYLIKTIAANFKTINKMFAKCLPDIDEYCLLAPEAPSPSLCDIKRNLLKIRLLHKLSRKSVKRLNSAYGLYLLGTYVNIIVMFAVSSYMLVIIRVCQPFLIFDVVVHGIVVVITILMSNDVQIQVRFFIRL